MIQDASPIRSGIPDHYRAVYKITVVNAANDWQLDQSRLPSGFSGRTPGSSQCALGSAGRGRITLPTGLIVRGVSAHADRFSVTGTQQNVFLGTINLVDGVIDFMLTPTTAPSTLTDPLVGTVIYIGLDLETV